MADFTLNVPAANVRTNNEPHAATAVVKIRERKKNKFAIIFEGWKKKLRLRVILNAFRGHVRAFVILKDAKVEVVGCKYKFTVVY